MPRSWYVHWPSAGFSSRSSHLSQCQQLDYQATTQVMVFHNKTYTLCSIIVAANSFSPSATCMISSIKPAPILPSISLI